MRDLRTQRFGRRKRRAGVDDFTSSPFVKELEVKSQVFSPVGSASVLEIPGNSNVQRLREVSSAVSSHRTPEGGCVVL